MKLQKNFLMIAVFALSVLLSACASFGPPDTTKLHIKDLKIGTGAEAAIGKQVVVHYSGWQFDATKPDYKGRLADTSRTGKPFTFTLGQSRVIKGWEEGIPGMKVGGQRNLIVPAEKAYGANSYGLIPSNSILIFDIELVEVK